MPAKSTKNVSLKETPSRLETTESQTDASEWVEYEMDMKDLHEILKEEGIDVPLDEKGEPILTPEFIKNLPPSVQPHAGGKKYTGGKPFKSTLGIPAKGVLGRGDQTRTSIWEEYKVELNELYKALEKNGVKVPRDEDGVPIFDENLIKDLPPEDVPHPAGKEFTPIAGLPQLPDGTRVSPRLIMRLLTPALEKDLLRLCKRKGIEVPMLNGKPEITSDFLRSLPPELLKIVLQPVYDNQQKLSENRESAIRRMSDEKKAPLKNLLEKRGIQVKKTKQGEFIIPVIAIMQFTEDEVSEVVGAENMKGIFKPVPRRATSIPDDALTNLSTEKRHTLGQILRDIGLDVEVDNDDIPIITNTLATLLPKETLDEFGIALGDIVKPSVTDVSGTEDQKRKSTDKPQGGKKSRKNIRFGTGKGLFNLMNQSTKDQLKKRLSAAGIEVKMTEEGEMDLGQLPEHIVEEFTTTIQEELKAIDAQEMHQRILGMVEDERQRIYDHLEKSGIDLPADETGNKVLTVEFLETLPRDILINLLAKLFGSPRSSLDRGNEEEEEDAENDNQDKKNSMSGKAETEDEDVDLELTDDQREDFYDKLLEEGIRAPMDEVTGKPRFTREFIRTIPKHIAREIISVVAVNADEPVRRFSSSEDSDDEDEEKRKPKKQSREKEPEVKPEDLILGLRYTPDGLGFVADEKGQKIKYESIMGCLKNAYSDSSLKKHDDFNKEKEAILRAAIREERRQEDKDPEIKRVGSDVEMQIMTMKFIPEYNPKPEKTDPINLFEHASKSLHQRSEPQAPPHQRGVEFVHILEPTFPTRKVDSLATLPSTMARKFSNDSVRGSALSTRLSDMPSMYSQALSEDPSTALVTASTQEFDINPGSVSDYREKWLSSFMSGYTPKQTITISIINMITRKQVELRVCKENSLNEVCHMYMQYEDHPEFYVWKDIYGRVLIPEKTLVENGLMRQDEVLEFQGYRRSPVILLYFRDGFENDPPLPLNPLHALKQRDPGLCRNY